VARLTAGDDDGVRATCNEAGDDDREAATSGRRRRGRRRGRRRRRRRWRGRDEGWRRRRRRRRGERRQRGDDGRGRGERRRQRGSDGRRRRQRGRTGETTEGRAREAQDWRPEEGHTASIRKQGPCVGAAWRGAPAHPRITGLPGTLARATRSRRPLSIFASTCSCAPRVFRRASQGPQGRVVPFGGARRGPDRRLRTAVQQRRPCRVPRFTV
jgi:hypothetical protein